jgi:Mg2+/citrate symporter
MTLRFGWRDILSILGALLFVSIFLVPSFIADHGLRQEAVRWLLGISCVLMTPWAIATARKEHADKKAQKRWRAEHPEQFWMAEAKRNGVLKTNWVNVLMLLSVVPVSVIGLSIAARFVDNAGGAGLCGLIPALGLLVWLGARERKRSRTIPKGVIGRTNDGVYVYDLDLLKKEEGAAR